MIFRRTLESEKFRIKNYFVSTSTRNVVRCGGKLSTEERGEELLTHSIEFKPIPGITWRGKLQLSFENLRFKLSSSIRLTLFNSVVVSYLLVDKSVFKP